MLNVSALLVPPGVVTVTFRVPADALPETMKDAVSEVPLTTVTVPAETPELLNPIAVEPEIKFVPVSSTVRVVPCVEEFGVMPLRLGAAGTVTLNVTEPLLPATVETEISRFPVGAVGAIVNIAVSVVLFTTLMALAVTPVPEMVIDVPPLMKFVPVSVT